jgi:putative tryptophan/tyrosine transport system substrate-binding protein
MIDYYWSVFNVERAEHAARDVLGLTPDVIVCAGTPATKALKQATSTVPIVFAIVTEPVAQGIVDSLAHPGGNLTGFTYLEPIVGAKWLELLMQIAPHLKHVALMFNPGSSPYSKLFFQSIETATSRFAVQAVMAPVHDVNEIEQLAAGEQTGQWHDRSCGGVQFRQSQADHRPEHAIPGPRDLPRFRFGLQWRIDSVLV